MKEISDRELVIRLHAGDVEAFNSFYWKYHREVYLNIFKLVKEPEASQDILQEVFLAFWEKRFSFDPAQPVAGWLFVVSYHKAINYLKKTLKDSVMHHGFDEETPADGIDVMIKETRFQLLEQAVAQLSPQKRKVFELSKLKGKSYEEIALELRISKHTVKEYLAASISSIKEYIRQHGGEATFLFLHGSLLLCSQ